jgi:hypothetical protein
LKSLADEKPSGVTELTKCVTCQTPLITPGFCLLCFVSGRNANQPATSTPASSTPASSASHRQSDAQKSMAGIPACMSFGLGDSVAVANTSRATDSMTATKLTQCRRFGCGVAIDDCDEFCFYHALDDKIAKKRAAAAAAKLKELKVKKIPDASYSDDDDEQYPSTPAPGAPKRRTGCKAPNCDAEVDPRVDVTFCLRHRKLSLLDRELARDEGAVDNWQCTPQGLGSDNMPTLIAVDDSSENETAIATAGAGFDASASI